MPFMDFVKTVAPFVPVVGPAIGAVAGLIGSRQTNSAQDARQEDAQSYNAEEARINREWSAEQASIQRDYQERLSNSAYQRATTDMRAAGINPMLAYSQGGASVPVGAAGTSSAASSPAPQPVQNVAEGASRGAAAMMASAQQFAQIANIDASTEATKQTARKTEIEADMLEDEKLWEGDPEKPWTDEKGRVHYDFKRDEEGKLIPRGRLYDSSEKKRIENIWTRERAQLTQQERFLVEQEIKNANAEERRIQANTGNIEADTVLKKLRAAEEGAASAFWKANPGYYGVREGVKTGSEVVNSAAKALGTGIGLTPGGRAGRVVQHLHRRVP